jgi:hypothetical protein
VNFHDAPLRQSDKAGEGNPWQHPTAEPTPHQIANEIVDHIDPGNSTSTSANPKAAFVCGLSRANVYIGQSREGNRTRLRLRLPYSTETRGCLPARGGSDAAACCLVQPSSCASVCAGGFGF